MSSEKLSDAVELLCRIEPLTVFALSQRYVQTVATILIFCGCINMESVNIETARALVRSNTVTKAIVKCFDGQRWSIVLRGRDEFVLRSARDRHEPKAFAKVETALAEIRGLGLRHAEINFEEWRRDGANP